MSEGCVTTSKSGVKKLNQRLELVQFGKTLNLKPNFKTCCLTLRCLSIEGSSKSASRNTARQVAGEPFDERRPFVNRDRRLRQIKPELHRRFDLLNDGSVYRTQRPLQFHDRNTADSLRVKSPGFQTACMMWNFKTITPKSGRARNVTHYRALMIQIDNAENETRTRFLGHAQVNYPQFSASRLRHDFSSRSYMANISADAPIIRRYSSNQADNSDNSVGESCSIAFSISATVLMRRKLPSHILTGKFIPLRLIPSLSAFSHLFSHVQLRPRRVF